MPTVTLQELENRGPTGKLLSMVLRLCLGDRCSKVEWTYSESPSSDHGIRTKEAEVADKIFPLLKATDSDGTSYPMVPPPMHVMGGVINTLKEIAEISGAQQSGHFELSSDPETANAKIEMRLGSFTKGETTLETVELLLSN